MIDVVIVLCLRQCLFRFDKIMNTNCIYESIRKIRKKTSFLPESKYNYADRWLAIFFPRFFHRKTEEVFFCEYQYANDISSDVNLQRQSRHTIPHIFINQSAKPEFDQMNLSMLKIPKQMRIFRFHHT